nr:hypothetical protein CFP56_33562 [Quercus suber]
MGRAGVQPESHVAKGTSGWDWVTLAHVHSDHAQGRQEVGELSSSFDGCDRWHEQGRLGLGHRVLTLEDGGVKVVGPYKDGRHLDKIVAIGSNVEDVSNTRRPASFENVSYGAVLGFDRRHESLPSSQLVRRTFAGASTEDGGLPAFGLVPLPHWPGLGLMERVRKLARYVVAIEGEPEEEFRLELYDCCRLREGGVTSDLHDLIVGIYALPFPPVGTNVHATGKDSGVAWVHAPVICQGPIAGWWRTEPRRSHCWVAWDMGPGCAVQEVGWMRRNAWLDSPGPSAPGLHKRRPARGHSVHEAQPEICPMGGQEKEPNRAPGLREVEDGTLAASPTKRCRWVSAWNTWQAVYRRSTGSGGHVMGGSKECMWRGAQERLSSRVQ